LAPIDVPPPRPTPRLAAVAAAMVGAGVALCTLGLVHAPDRSRLALAWLWSFAFVWSIGLGSLFFLALHYLTHAIWSVVIKRVADMLASTLWLTAILFVPIAVFVLEPTWFGVFPWAAGYLGPPVRFKSEYLNAPFFLARAAVCLALWVGFAWYFVSRSLRQDRTSGDAKTQGHSTGHLCATGGLSASAGPAETLAGKPAAPVAHGGADLTAKMRRASAPFLLVGAITLTVASVDWLMSLQPNWFSTMFPVYVFAGVMVTGLAVLALATIWLRRAGGGSLLGRDLVRDEHLYCLGGLMFAFVCFWGYIGFSQYMLIWYANLPEESFYMVRRTSGGWLAVTVALWVIRFGIPFLVLLSRRAKMNPPVLVGISLLLLAGQLLDLYWLVMPAYHTDGPVLGWQEAGPLLLMIGGLGLSVARFVGRHALVATGDPMLEASRRFRL